MARSPQGWFRGMPFNWSGLSRENVGKGLWDPDDPRVLTPKNYGWGYGINFAALVGRRRRSPDQDEER
jgi:uncharacterized protein DUF5808